ncbi:hypothetical protein SynSYN20_01658 [Synechococcus sp. SYN20]|nr:hypothetical protein SynSYN20_01658 [Synechococcus sp. SYN20]
MPGCWIQATEPSITSVQGSGALGSAGDTYMSADLVFERTSISVVVVGS